MKAAVLLNPQAGGAGRLGEVASAVGALVSGHASIGVTGYGGEILRPGTLLPRPAQTGYLPALHAAVDALASHEPDVYIVAGGDGMAAYVADRLVTRGLRPRLLGVRMGTANVGPIIDFDAAELDGLSLDTLAFAPCGAVEALDGTAHVAFGFNDVVVGNTLLSTVDGQAVTVSARALAEEGKLVPEAPLASIGPALTVVKNGLETPSALSGVSQAVVSCLERENLSGRAVSGMLCFTGSGPERAALTLSSRPLVVLAPDPRGFARPAAMEQLLFSACDTLSLRGASPEALIVADGNPYTRRAAEIGFRYAPAIIETARRG